MSKHTRGRMVAKSWAVKNGQTGRTGTCWWLEIADRAIPLTDNNSDVPPELARGNAERLAACWNAFAGVEEIPSNRKIKQLLGLTKPVEKYTCPECGTTCDGNSHKKPSGEECDMVFGRRGWRQLGVYDG